MVYIKTGLILSFCGLHIACCYNVTDEDHLHKYLFSEYNKDLRAGIDRDYALNLSMKFYLFAIKEFTEATGKFALNGVFLISWVDERLAWDAMKFSNITETLVTKDKIWTPKILCRNPFEEAFGFGSSLELVQLYSNGACIWSSLQSYAVICDADVTYFPFDKQYCTLKFLATMLKENWLNITFAESKVDLSFYEENGLWLVEDTTTYTELIQFLPHVVVGLYLQRRPTFYIVCINLPLYFVASLQSFVFLLPNESGERLSFSVTLLLANVVFLTIIQENLPKSSEPSIPILGFFFLWHVIFGSIVTLCVILSSNIHSFEEDTPVPKSLRRFTCMNSNKVKKIISIEESLDSTTKENQKNKHREKQISRSWNNIAKFFDKFCFFCSLFLYVLQSIIYLAIIF